MITVILIVGLAAALGVGAWFAFNQYQFAVESARREGTREAMDVEKMFDSVYNEAPVGYQDIDIHGNIIRVNQKEVTLKGLRRDEMIGRNYADLYPEAHRRRMRDELDRKMMGSMSLVPYQRNYLRPDGKMLTLEVHEMMLRDHEGNVCGMRTASIDMTEPTKKQEAVWQATSELNAVFMAFPDLFLRLDNQGTVLSYRAPNVSEFFGPVEELTGVSLDTLLPADVAESLRQAASKALKSGHLVPVEYSLERSNALGDNAPRHFEARLIPLHWNEVVAIVREITERKEAETRLAQYAEQLKTKNQELSAALDAAQEATRLKSQFLANMSHEIRTPMNGVLGMTEFLLQTELTDEQREYAESVKESAGSLLVIINDILDLSKIEAGKLSLDFEPTDVVSLIREIASNFALRVRSKGLDFRLSLHDEQPMHVVADPNRVRQVLTNLLGNAFKFTESGAITVGTAIVPMESQDPNTVTVRFFVQDTGIGIPAHQQELLFQSFVQGQGGMNRKFGGTGLGLAISKQLVEMMGGKIGFESADREGSTFWFDVPFKREVDAAPEPEPLPVSLAGINVLVACESTTGWKPMFDAWGCRTEEVARAGTILPALRLAHRANRPFALLVIDASLHGFDPALIREQINGDATAAGVRTIVAATHVNAGIEEYFDVILQAPITAHQLQLAAAKALGAPSAPAPKIAPAPAIPPQPAANRHITGKHPVHQPHSVVEMQAYVPPAAPVAPAAPVVPPVVAPAPPVAVPQQHVPVPAPHSVAPPSVAPSVTPHSVAPLAPAAHIPPALISGLRAPLATAPPPPSNPAAAPAAPQFQAPKAAAPRPINVPPAKPAAPLASGGLTSKPVTFQAMTTKPPTSANPGATIPTPPATIARPAAPIAKPATPVSAAKAQPKQPIEPPHGISPKSRILLAEDNVVNQKIAMKLLEKVGLSADLAQNGAEAVALVQKAPYDLILMDCMMPEMDGFEATRQIRLLEAAARRHTPIVAITANAMKGDRERCLDSGMDDYVSKPFDLKALHMLIERWLAKRDVPV